MRGSISTGYLMSNSGLQTFRCHPFVTPGLDPEVEVSANGITCGKCCGQFAGYQ